MVLGMILQLQNGHQLRIEFWGPVSNSDLLNVEFC